jgi:uncharacterized protein YndB with AHSA1/START domain
MTVISVDKDLDSLTMTLIAEFEAPIERVWELWADPRKLERWWGPPGCPATFERHDLNPGAEAAYSMAVPDGEPSRGWWRITAVDPPRRLEFTDGWADRDGTPIAAGPTMSFRVELADHDDRTRMELRVTFSSREHMEEFMRTDALENFQRSVGQMDALLAA